MSYGIRHNRCEGWYQPVFHRRDGHEHRGAKWPTRKEAYDAILFHHQNGQFPSEVKEEHVKVCEKCGQPLPEK